MIITGTPGPEPDKVKIKADLAQFRAGLKKAAEQTDDFVRYLTQTARWTLELEVRAELANLTPDGAWALLYARGAMDPDFAHPDAVDHYLRILVRIGGDLGHAARVGFLTGWAEHRAKDEYLPVLTWHRLLGDTAVSVGRAAA